MVTNGEVVSFFVGMATGLLYLVLNEVLCRSFSSKKPIILELKRRRQR